MQSKLDQIISQLYGAATRISPEGFRVWALELIQQLMNFDAALWATGNLEKKTFHYVAELNLDTKYAQRLKATLEINPLKPAMLSSLNQPVCMSDIYADEEFFNSSLFAELFQPYQISRIMGVASLDQRSGLYSLISLYRNDRTQDFNAKEKDVLARLVFHLNAAATHVYFAHLQLSRKKNQTAAICDAQGYYYEVQEDFLNIIESCFPAHKVKKLPFELPVGSQVMELSDLSIQRQPLGDLCLVLIRQRKPVDRLSSREKEIVLWITKGLTFKEVGKKLELAPSTVSNHLYRVYQKLGITSRTELAELFL